MSLFVRMTGSDRIAMQCCAPSTSIQVRSPGSVVPSAGRDGSTGFVVGVVVLISVCVLAFLYGTLFLSCGLHLMAVKQVRGEPIVFRDVFTGGPLFWRMLFFNLLMFV